MSGYRNEASITRSGLVYGAALVLIVAVSACDGILDVEVPGQVTRDALFQPDQATILVNSAASLFECGYSDFIASKAAGFEDVLTRDTGYWGGVLEYNPEPRTSNCNTSEVGVGWWTPIHAGRDIAEQTYQNMSEEWSVEEIVGDRERMLAELAILNGAIYGFFGEHFCEISYDGGPLMGPDESLAVGEQWLTDALDHISSAGGDFAIPGGTSPSAREMALALRARIRFAAGDETGAVADAEEVSQGFESYVTRDAGGERTRWNKMFSSHNQEQITTVLPAVDWWDGGVNPATGEDWPAIIPFTGYQNLGILPDDGRAVTGTGHAITTVDEPTAVPDPRVPVVDEERVFQDLPIFRQEKYGLDSDIPVAKWEEMWLIRAKVEGGQAAVDLINDIRDYHGLPEVSYVDPGDAEEVYNMILEEERRSLFLEGRWWSTKIQERLWFPRGTGRTIPPTSFGLLGGVRAVMPEDEFELNENFDLSDRATMCDPLERPDV